MKCTLYGEEKKLTSEIRLFCGYCKKIIENNNDVYLCIKTSKVFCYDCEHKKKLPFNICFQKFDVEHTHNCLPLSYI